jgi:hypothetical protein
MAGKSWKSHQNTSSERDMDADHEAQLREWAPPRIARRQEIRDGYARNVDPAVQAARAHDAEDAQEQSATADQIAADWARSTGQSFDPNGPVQVDSVQRLPARVQALRRKVPGEPGDRSAQIYVPPPPDPQYRADADYPSVVAANTRVVPAENPRPDADIARFQTQLATAQQVAAQQMQAQRQADTEAAERLASAALGQYIAPTSAAPARTPHR